MNIFILPRTPADRRTPYPTYFSPPRTPYTVTTRTPCLLFARPPAVGAESPPPRPPMPVRVSEFRLKMVGGESLPLKVLGRNWSLAAN